MRIVSSFSLVLVFAVASAGCDSPETVPMDSSADAAADNAESPDIDGARARAVVQSMGMAIRPSAPEGQGLDPVATPGPALRDGAASRYERRADAIVPVFSPEVLAVAGRLAKVELPKRASGAFRVEDAELPGFSMSVSLRGAGDASAEEVDGYLVYRRGGPSGVDVVHRPSAEGTEDYLGFPKAPAIPEVFYDIALGDGVKGLRLVANTLELLDGDGVPRLRISPPFLVDRDGDKLPASLELLACDADRNPAVPMGRKVTDPGSRQCAVRVGWEDLDVSYPAVLDPSWATTGTLAVGRYYSSATKLADGRVLVVGGNNGAVLSSSEVYDPETGAWTTLGALTGPRQYLVTARLPDGDVLAIGGHTGGAVLATVDRLDVDAGTWAATTAMSNLRYVATATVLDDGKVLVFGGYNGSAAVTNGEVFDPSGSTWTVTGNAATGRYGHTATLLDDGIVLFTGGVAGGVYLNTASLYEIASDTWAAVPTNMANARYLHTATELEDGKVLVVGGYTSGSTFSGTAELYDPAANAWTSAGTLASSRAVHSSDRLLNGRVLVAGGYNGSTLASAVLYNPATNAWQDVTGTNTVRCWHLSTLLDNGKVLLASGYNGAATTSATLFRFNAEQGGSCVNDLGCTNNNCVDGVCCDTACGDGDTTDCIACSEDLGAETDGTCGLVAVDTPCGSDDETACDLADSCDASGTCLENYVADTVVCRAAAGACDVADTCDGEGACGADEKSSAECRASEGECDPAEACDGENDVCPADAVAASGTACGSAAATACDAADTCDGDGNCQSNYTAEGTVCREAAGECDVAEACDGDGVCPADGKSSAECRASTGECDPAEACGGDNAECPENLIYEDGRACDDGDPLTEADSCGLGGVCEGTPIVGTCGDPIEIDDLPYEDANTSAGAPNGIAAFGAGCGEIEGAAGEMVYELDVTEGQGIKISVAPAAGFDAAVAVLSDCADNTGCLAFMDAAKSGAIEEISYEADADRTLTIAVGGATVGDEGAYTLSVIWTGGGGNGTDGDTDSSPEAENTVEASGCGCAAAGGARFSPSVVGALTSF